MKKFFNWLIKIFKKSGGSKVDIKKDQITTINMDSTTNVLLVEIIKELKEMNKLFVRYELKLEDHNQRITKLEMEK